MKWIIEGLKKLLALIEKLKELANLWSPSAFKRVRLLVWKWPLNSKVRLKFKSFQHLLKLWKLQEDFKTSVMDRHLVW